MMPTAASTAPTARLAPTELGGSAPADVVAPEEVHWWCFTAAVANAAPAPARSTAPARHTMWEPLAGAAAPVCGAWRATRRASAAIERCRTPGARRVLLVAPVREVTST